jgi:hypothetical protein
MITVPGKVGNFDRGIGDGSADQRLNLMRGHCHYCDSIN